MNMHEIERRFLVTATVEEIKDRLLSDYPKRKLYVPHLIVQSYIPDSGSLSMRVRQITTGPGETGYFLTVKRRETAVTSVEIEHPITREVYAKYATLSDHEPIRKLRHRDLYGEFTVDKYLNPKLDGLLKAEIELNHEDEWFSKPWWLGEEVTGQKEYTDFYLAQQLRYPV